MVIKVREKSVALLSLRGKIKYAVVGGRVMFRFPSERRDYSLCQGLQTASGAHPFFLVVAVAVLSEVMWPGHEASLLTSI